MRAPVGTALIYAPGEPRESGLYPIVRFAARSVRARAPRIEARILALSPEGLILPGSCACCGGIAASSRVEIRSSDGASLIVPYCTDCQRHASAAVTRTLAVTVASCLLAATLAATLPLIDETQGLLAYGTIVLVGALVPILAAAFWPRRIAPGHTTTGRAVWWLSGGALCCTNPRWAAELAVEAGVEPRRQLLGERVLSPWMLAGPLLALGAAPFLYWLYHPGVRVVDLTGTRIEVRVDGRTVASVQPTSAESPAAGVELRLPAGQHVLESRDSQGRVVARANVFIHSGAEHLYAPGARGYCFWLETTGYGRAGAVGPVIRPLAGAARFWALPLDVDTWFAPNPPPSHDDVRSSGGELTALRQARCSEAPAAARP